MAPVLFSALLLLQFKLSLPIFFSLLSALLFSFGFDFLQLHLQSLL